MPNHRGVFATENYTIAHPLAYKVLRALAIIEAISGFILAFIFRHDHSFAVMLLLACLISAAFIWGFAVIIKLLSELVWLNMTEEERSDWYFG